MNRHAGGLLQHVKGGVPESEQSRLCTTHGCVSQADSRGGVNSTHSTK